MDPFHVDQLEGRLIDAQVQPEIVDSETDRREPARLRAPSQRPGGQHRLAWFCLVGGTAAAVHWSIAVFTVSRCAWSPLAANALGWMIAFGVSFGGHRRLTFRHHGPPLHSSLGRFFLISAGGFAINETAYALLLPLGGARYDVLLAAVLVVLAGVTYWLSRHWAFFRSETDR